MVFSLYEIARNPEIQENIRKEVKDILNKHGGSYTFEAIKEMVYLEQCIQGINFYIFTRQPGQELNGCFLFFLTISISNVLL